MLKHKIWYVEHVKSLIMTEQIYMYIYTQQNLQNCKKKY